MTSLSLLTCRTVPKWSRTGNLTHKCLNLFLQRDFRVHHEDDESREAVADDEDDGEEDDDLDSEIQQIKNNQTDISSEKLLNHEQTTDSIEQKDSENFVYDISDIDSCSLLHMECLNEWDYPIFDLSNSCRNSILSKVRTISSEKQTYAF